jgi:hypothetical protein
MCALYSGNGEGKLYSFVLAWLPRADTKPVGATAAESDCLCRSVQLSVRPIEHRSQGELDLQRQSQNHSDVDTVRAKLTRWLWRKPPG